MNKCNLSEVIDEHQRHMELLESIGEMLSSANEDTFLPESLRRSLISISADIAHNYDDMAVPTSIALGMLHDAVTSNST
jgi:uncharacterized protein (UPF0147 family)